MRRPTTGVAHAVVWDAAGAGPLLDWLEIPRRHALEPQDDLRGLVLLDLPDHDSTEVAHRLEVDRLVAMVDVLVWVLDPQKYADAAIHDRYLRPLARHGDVMVVVLNQVDRLAPTDIPGTVADVRRLLTDDGLPDVPVLAVSATAGTGLDRLRDVLTGAVAAHRAALRRIAADLDTVSASWRTWSAVPPGTTSTAGRSARSSPRWERPGSPRSVRRCSGRRSTGPWRRPASRSPAGRAACGRIHCGGCTSTGHGRRR